MIRVSAGFDSGAIELRAASAGGLVTPPEDGAPVVIALGIRRDATADPQCDFRQWFHFRVQGAAGRRVAIELDNAGRSTYPDGWRDYRACASYDRRDWFRVPTRFDGERLTIEHAVAHDSVWYAYFEPYSWERHLDLVARMAAGGARVATLGTTPDGRDLDCVSLGAARPDAPQVWVIARQHPGETMAEWFVEGLLDRLVDSSDALARTLLRTACFHVVPNMNPDGAVRGNLRANATGANLNREWASPSAERSPEVALVRAAIERTGCDLFLDVHGDEGLPWVFVAGAEMLPDFSPALRDRQARFCAAFRAASPDFQTVHGYGAGKFSAESLRLASKWVAHRFGCLALTLEMPFKDNADLPDPRVGWNGARSRRLGAAVLAPIAATLPSAPGGA